MPLNAAAQRDVSSPSENPLADGWCDIVGRGRMGEALAAALRELVVPVRGPLGRGADAAGARIVLLCVPDREIARPPRSSRRARWSAT